MINRVLIFLIFFSIALFANINLQVPSKALYDEPFIFTIEVIGEDVKFPPLDNIDGNIVQELTNSTSTTIINSQITKKIKKKYLLYPKKSFTFPALKFEIDGKEYLSKEKNIVLEDVKKTKSDIFDLEIKASKDNLYVGENFILTIFFKYKTNTQIVDLSLQNPSFDNFWFKQLNKTKKFDEGEYTVQELKFLMIPLRSGELKINPLSIVAQIIDAKNAQSFSLFSRVTKDIKIYSNSLKFNVLDLPDNVSLIGKFKLTSSVNKTTINKGEAISYKIRIEGEGNIEDIPDLKLDIKNATIYENKPKIETTIVDEKIKGSYEKVFSIIPSSSIKIPSIKLKYFDKYKNEIIHLSSKSFDIKLNEKNTININNPKLEKEEKKIVQEKIVVKEETSFLDKVIYFILGIIVTLFGFFIYFYFINIKRNNQEYNTPLIKKIKKAKTKEELLKVLAIYININKDLDFLIFKLEKTDDIKLVKKELEKKVSELKI